jgi:hypothetical protein
MLGWLEWCCSLGKAVDTWCQVPKLLAQDWKCWRCWLTLTTLVVACCLFLPALLDRNWPWYQLTPIDDDLACSHLTGTGLDNCHLNLKIKAKKVGGNHEIYATSLRLLNIKLSSFLENKIWFNINLCSIITAIFWYSALLPRIEKYLG